MKNIAAFPSPCLDVRDLQVVLALRAAGTTSEAALLLHLTQPAVSRALLSAESRLGARLFDRTPRGLVPTPAGERLLAAAPRVLSDLVDAEHLARAPQAEVTPMRIVCECYTAYHWLPSALASMRQKIPALQLSLAIEHSQDPVAALLRGEIDAALLTTATVPRGVLRQRPLFSDEIVFVVSSSHPLAARRTLTHRDLLCHPILTGNTPAAEAQWFMKRVFGRSRPRLHMERLPLTEALVDVARAGMGIAVLSEWIANPYLDRGDLLVKRLDSGALQRPWRLAWRPEHDETALRLASALATVPRPRADGMGR